ncbi:MAG: hypothetical protein JWP91_519 [Fibrobacteres bacterium]|nr:hypothetical protein [Fibrobacterota bacterium]
MPTETPSLKPVISRIDWNDASPDEIKAEIARTRAHMDARLSDLGRKFKPKVNVKRARIPAAVLAAALTGFLLFRAFRPKSKLVSWSRRKKPASARMQRLKVKSAGMADYVRAIGLVMNVIRKGKPAVFIVEPGKG